MVEGVVADLVPPPGQGHPVAYPIFHVLAGEKEGRPETEAVQRRRDIVELAVQAVVVSQADRGSSAIRPRDGLPATGEAPCAPERRRCDGQSAEAECEGPARDQRRFSIASRACLQLGMQNIHMVLLTGHEQMVIIARVAPTLKLGIDLGECQLHGGMSTRAEFTTLFCRSPNVSPGQSKAGICRAPPL